MISEDVRKKIAKWASTTCVHVRVIEDARDPDIITFVLEGAYEEFPHMARPHVEVEWPADWVEAVKARFLPAWARRRWPVVMARRVIRTKVISDGLIAVPTKERE
jgi:hypothetical protein